MALFPARLTKFFQQHPILRRVLFYPFAFFLICFLFILYCIQTESGTALVWKAATYFSHGTLQGTLTGGRIKDGIQLNDVHIHTATSNIQIDSMDSQWRWTWSDRTLTVNTLHIGDINAAFLPDDTPKESSPLVKPDSLALPVNLRLEDITLNQLTLEQTDAPLVFSDIALSGVSNQEQHALTLERITTPWGTIGAQANIETQLPFHLSGSADLHGQYDEKAYQLHTAITGNLDAMDIALNAQGEAIEGKAQATLHPFLPQFLSALTLQIDNVNPKIFSASAPEAKLSAQANLTPVTDNDFRIKGKINIQNHLAGAIDKDQIPVSAVSLNVDIDADNQQFSDAVIRLMDQATIEGKGSFSQKDGLSGNLQLQTRQFNLHTLHSALHVTQLNGPLTVAIQDQRTTFQLDLKDKRLQFTTKGEINPEAIQLSTLRLAIEHSVIEAQGKLQTQSAQPYEFTAKLENFNPAVLLQHPEKQPQGAIFAAIKAQGQLNQPNHQINFDIAPKSRYANLPLNGHGKLHIQGTRLMPSQAQLSVAGNDISLKGSFGQSNETLHIAVNAPRLEALGYGITGHLNLNGTLQGTPTTPHLTADIDGKNLHFSDYTLQTVKGNINTALNLNQPLNHAQNKIAAHITLQGVQTPYADLNNSDIVIDGHALQHQMRLTTEGSIRGKALHFATSAEGKVLYKNAQYGWEGIIRTFENQSKTAQDLPSFTLTSPLAVHALPNDIVIGASALKIRESVLKLKRLVYNTNTLSSAGELQQLHINDILALIQETSGQTLPLKSSMILNGQWDFALGRQATGGLEITRQEGDLSFDNGNAFIPLNLSELVLRADLSGKSLKLDTKLASGKLGNIHLSGTSSLITQSGMLRITPESQLNMQLQLVQPNLNNVSILYGPQMRLQGTLNGKLAIQGTVKSPLVTGQINGDHLAFTLMDQGITLNQGRIALALDNNVLTMNTFEFHGGKGTLQLQGQLDLANPQDNMQATAVADQLEIFASPTRQLTLEGKAILNNNNSSKKLSLTGDIKVLRALFDIPASSVPSLDDDVKVVDSEVELSQQKNTVKKESAFIPSIALTLDLGPNFYFKDVGADLQLAGLLHILRQENEGIRGEGTINAVGQYEAFGTKLNIERGLINFQGPLSSPNLNIRAMTKDQEVNAGVEVTGNPNHPRIQLVSEPNVADEEKLSWLMFGKGSQDSDITQNQAASQALAVVGTYGGRQIAQKFGFDQFAIGASDAGLTDTQVVSVGKTITRKISIGIEKALSGPDSIAKFTWNFSRRWSFILRGGTINGINLLHNRRFD